MSNAGWKTNSKPFRNGLFRKKFYVELNVISYKKMMKTDFPHVAFKFHFTFGSIIAAIPERPKSS
jgi:hypothetical protein